MVEVPAGRAPNRPGPTTGVAEQPTDTPTQVPVQQPTTPPTPEATLAPTAEPTIPVAGQPTEQPTIDPTQEPVVILPTNQVTAVPQVSAPLANLPRTGGGVDAILVGLLLMAVALLLYRQMTKSRPS